MVDAYESEPHDFVPISSVYKPIGWLYRPIAEDICLTCGQRKANHTNRNEQQ